MNTDLVLQTCYIFTPEQPEPPEHIGQRPEKRRKIAKASNPSIHNGFLPFVPLLSGTENSDSVQTRLELFAHAWSTQEKPLDVKVASAGPNTSNIDCGQDLLESSNADAINHVISFIQAVEPTE